MGDAQGLAFDAAVEEYERGRTGWPEGVADGIDAEHVLDLAAGTGKLTRVLVRRFPRVTAVEPLPGMRALGASLVPEATWLEGTAEQLPLEDGSADAAFVGDGFHWFDSAAAVNELARVLKSGAPVVVGFIAWKSAFEPGLPTGALEAVSDVSRRTGTPGGPKWMSGDWALGFEGAPFAPLTEREVSFDHVTDREGVIAYYLSMSTVAARPDEERAALADELRRLTPDGEHRLALSARLFETVRR
jgi:SAM-dependent methyltransferase